jgi:rsbT co-antagonist protein RsbR
MHTFSSPFLAAILEQLPFFVALKDAESRRYVLVNASFCALMGRPSDELQSKRDEEIIGDLRATEQRGLEDRVIATGQPMIVPEISFGATRDERTLSVSLVPLSEGGNGVSHLLVSGQDITRQKLATRELAAQKDFIRQVIDADPSLVFVKDRHGNFILANQAVADLFDKTIEEITNQNNAVLHDNPAEVEHYTRTDREVLATLREVRVEDPITFRDGRRRWHQTIKRPLVRPGGEVQILGICTDITELKEARERSEQTSRELQIKADEARREADAKAALAEELDRKLEVIHAQHEQIRSLSVPLLDVGGGVLGVPLIGTMDEQRAIDLTHRLLRSITERRVRDVILDLTGIEAVDTGAIDHLLRIVRAVRLLGARTLITGISPALAQAMTALDVDLSGVVTMRTLRDALLACADLTGPLQGERDGGHGG